MVAALGVVLWAGVAAAQSLTVSLPAAQAPLVNAMTVGLDSAVQFQVSHTNASRRYTQIDFRPPSTSYTLLPGSVGPAGWTSSIVTINNLLTKYQVVRFTAPCGSGLPAQTPVTFTIKLRPAVATGANPPVTVDFPSSAFSVSASTGACSTLPFTATSTRTVPLKVLSVTGAGTALQQLAPPAVVVWTIANQSTQAKTGVTVSPIAPGQVCGPSIALGAYTAAGARTGTVRCTYPATGNRSYTFSTNAAGSPQTSTAVGATVGPIDVGAASISWSRSTLLRGRVRDPVTIVVNNASRATIARVDLITTASGFGVSGADATAGALAYAPGQSSALDFAFTGSIGPGQIVALDVRFASIPAGAGPFPFQVKLTPTSGADYAITFASQNVTVQTVAFPPDVSGLTIRSVPANLATGEKAGQTLTWTNPTTGHAGVAIFRADPPARPSQPIDGVDYALTPGNGVVYANRTDPNVRSAQDLTPGAFNYLVCNHDANLVYSECNPDGSARGHYAGNSAVAPDGGWTDQVGGEALGLLAIYSDRAAVPTTRGDVSILKLADGSRAAGLAPVRVTSALPSTYMPSWRLANKTLVALAADQGGNVTAVDLEAGTQYWRVSLPGESFTAGASGVSSAGGTAAFKAAYPNRDLLFLGSSTTGRVYAIDAATGATLWTFETGSTVDALISYDSINNQLWVPTAAGVQAWDLAPSGPNPSTPPRLRWSANLGPHSMYCVKTTSAALMACIDNGGTLRVLDKLTGEVKSSLSTGVTLASTLVRAVSGTPGFIVGSARGLVRVTAADATLTSLSVYQRWEQAGWTYSPAILFAGGYVVVSASDLSSQGLHIYKRSSDDLHDMGRSPDVVRPANPSTRVGPPSFDGASNLYFFGTEEGRVWAIPSF